MQQKKIWFSGAILNKIFKITKMPLGQKNYRKVKVETLFMSKDENIDIDGNIEGKKYRNIGGNIEEISISILIKF